MSATGPSSLKALPLASDDTTTAKSGLPDGSGSRITPQRAASALSIRPVAPAINFCKAAFCLPTVAAMVPLAKR